MNQPEAQGVVHAQVHVTLDGVIQANGGPTPQDGDYPYAGWQSPYWNAAAAERLVADIEACDALLLGRVTYDIFRGYWPEADGAIAEVFNGVPKYVASRRGAELTWKDSTQLTDLAAEVDTLRTRHREIHVWGSGDLLRTLFRLHLVDRLTLWACPVVLGQGKRLFPDGAPPLRLQALAPPEQFDAGVVRHRFACLDEPPAPRVRDAD
ncbi:dihydrofolate reductase family protein [Nesterenkonia sp. K-15-9-6]|uniref:dihydrofolate reductase family protein n=1 Tax=Nesterenkonia sp. K-15-9-6 TaxID=3093918 RepID=UPI00404505A0